MTQTILNGEMISKSKWPEVLHYLPEKHLFDNHFPKFSFPYRHISLKSVDFNNNRNNNKKCKQRTNYC